LYNAIKWILVAVVSGVIGNRADDLLMALVDTVRAQRVYAGSAPTAAPTPQSPLPTPVQDSPLPEPPPEPPQVTRPSRSTPTPHFAFDWVTIPAGTFLMGSDKAKDKDAYSSELPQHKVYLPTYRIARVPVTVAQFTAFVQATGYQTKAEKDGWAYSWTGEKWEPVQGAYWAAPRGPASHVRDKADHPVTCVSWRDATAFCVWAAKVQRNVIRLPTEAEWEKAARGTDGRVWPWGNEPPDDRRCNFNMNVRDTTSVKHYPAGAHGLYDMAGNVWEWTSSLYKDYPYNVDDGREDPAAEGRRVVRGGSFGFDRYYVRCALRLVFDPVARHFYNGLRVVSPGS
jgi:formylglycine-generating enzyme required for sulfatase activity